MKQRLPATACHGLGMALLVLAFAMSGCGDAPTDPEEERSEMAAESVVEQDHDCDAEAEYEGCPVHAMQCPQDCYEIEAQPINLERQCREEAFVQVGCSHSDLGFAQQICVRRKCDGAIFLAPYINAIWEGPEWERADHSECSPADGTDFCE